jgi:hypothetical protein
MYLDISNAGERSGSEQEIKKRCCILWVYLT